MIERSCLKMELKVQGSVCRCWNACLTVALRMRISKCVYLTKAGGNLDEDPIRECFELKFQNRCTRTGTLTTIRNERFVSNYARLSCYTGLEVNLVPLRCVFLCWRRLPPFVRESCPTNCQNVSRHPGSLWLVQQYV